MGVNNILVICIVCYSTGLSTPFLSQHSGHTQNTDPPIHYGHHLSHGVRLQCFEHVCEHSSNKGQQDGKRRDTHHYHHSHPHCVISSSTHGMFKGHCGESHDHNNMCNQHAQDDSTCRCYDQPCIDGFVERNIQYQARYKMTYSCLKHECHGTYYCLIKMDDDEIKSSCHANMHNSQGMCLNHDSVTSSHGCYCNTTECVQKTALHCLGVNCKLTEGCRITQYNGEFQATCHTLHDHDDDCDSDDTDCIPSCNVPLILDNGHIPCYCESQICADNIQVNVPTTNKPSTTTVPALQQLDPYTCVAETCDKYVSKCNLYELKNQIEGRCMILPVGELCSPSNDLSVFGGCYCSDSKCVINAITDYNHKHITVPTLAPEYLCEKASCRSDMLCQLYTYQGVATGRCLAFHTGTNCLSYKDVHETGCMCNNAACATNILAEYARNNQVTTTTSTKTESATPPATTTPSSTTPIMTTANPTTHTTTTPIPTTPTMTTLIPTTRIPITSTTTTPTSTTTTTTTTTPNTTPTTTTPTKTTTATGPRSCHICGDTSLPVPCSSRQIGRDLSHTCKTGENYCMTDIVQDDQGNVDVFKRCVDLATCEKKWITESADLDYCKRYGVVKNPYAFSCHFCCTEDKCNSMLVPNTTTWYTKTN